MKKLVLLVKDCKNQQVIRKDDNDEDRKKTIDKWFIGVKKAAN